MGVLYPIPAQLYTKQNTRAKIARICTRFSFLLFFSLLYYYPYLYIIVVYYIILFFLYWFFFSCPVAPFYMLPRFPVLCPVLSYHIALYSIIIQHNKQHQNTTNENRKIIYIFVGWEFCVGVFCRLRWALACCGVSLLGLLVFPVLLRTIDERY